MIFAGPLPTMNADKLVCRRPANDDGNTWPTRTTQVYINIARQMQTTADKLHVPDRSEEGLGLMVGIVESGSEMSCRWECQPSSWCAAIDVSQ